VIPIGSPPTGIVAITSTPAASVGDADGVDVVEDPDGLVSPDPSLEHDAAARLSTPASRSPLNTMRRTPSPTETRRERRDESKVPQALDARCS
jgi:hypothetical protein